MRPAAAPELRPAPGNRIGAHQQETRMTKRLSAAAALFLGLATLALAGEVAGVKMPDTETVEGKALKLNGMGLRTKYGVVKVYVLGLYLETRSADAGAVISSDQVKRIRMSFLRDVAGPKIAETITEGFERNSKAQMGTLKARLDKLATIVPDVVKGDEVVLTYSPGKGTSVQAKGTDRGVIEGKDFADALFSVWLGAVPAQEDLKKLLLGV
jgi:hypothetical protein